MALTSASRSSVTVSPARIIASTLCGGLRFLISASVVLIVVIMSFLVSACSRFSGITQAEVEGRRICTNACVCTVILSSLFGVCLPASCEASGFTQYRVRCIGLQSISFVYPSQVAPCRVLCMFRRIRLRKHQVIRPVTHKAGYSLFIFAMSAPLARYHFCGLVSAFRGLACPDWFYP